MRGITRWHPAVLAAFFAAVLAVTMFAAHPLLTAISLVGAVCSCAATGSLIRARDAWFYVLLPLLTALTNPLFSHYGDTVLFWLWRVPYTLESLAYGAVTGVALAATLLWCRCMGRVMTQEKWLALFGRVAPRLALALTMAMRFVPMLRRQGHAMWQAQKAAGLSDAERKRSRVRAAVRLLTSLTAWATEKAVDTGRSMQARGYGLAGRTAYCRQRFTLADAARLVMGVVLTVCALLAEPFEYYPILSGISLADGAWVAFAAFALLTTSPLLIAGKEWLEWRCYRSRI